MDATPVPPALSSPTDSDSAASNASCNVPAAQSASSLDLIAASMLKDTAIKQGQSDRGSAVVASASGLNTGPVAAMMEPKDDSNNGCLRTR